MTGPGRLFTRTPASLRKMRPTTLIDEFVLPSGFPGGGVSPGALAFCFPGGQIQHALSVRFFAATSWGWDEDLMGLTSEVHVLQSSSGPDASGVSASLGVYARLELGLTG